MWSIIHLLESIALNTVIVIIQNLDSKFQASVYVWNIELQDGCAQENFRVALLHRVPGCPDSLHVSLNRRQIVTMFFSRTVNMYSNNFVPPNHKAMKNLEGIQNIAKEYIAYTEKCSSYR